ncbi:MAG: hypothetical protein HYS23_15320 [Geobacter sp.]|nr:hypothetical protein [Geobacter sp.]
MNDQLLEISLPNGLSVRFVDHTRQYYGDYYLVKLEIICEAPIASEYFGEQADFEEAQRMLGSTVVYRKEVEQMGVPSTEIERVRERLVENFREHSLPYFERDEFPSKLVLGEFDKLRKKLGRFSA